MSSDQFNDRSIDAILSTILAEVRELRRFNEDAKLELKLAHERIATLEKFRWVMAGACLASGTMPSIIQKVFGH
jgi:hypothetical protein